MMMIRGASSALTGASVANASTSVSDCRGYLRDWRAMLDASLWQEVSEVGIKLGNVHAGQCWALCFYTKFSYSLLKDFT